MSKSGQVHAGIPHDQHSDRPDLAALVPRSNDRVIEHTQEPVLVTQDTLIFLWLSHIIVIDDFQSIQNKQTTNKQKIFFVVQFGVAGAGLGCWLLFANEALARFFGRKKEEEANNNKPCSFFYFPSTSFAPTIQQSIHPSIHLFLGIIGCLLARLGNLCYCC